MNPHEHIYDHHARRGMESPSRRRISLSGRRILLLAMGGALVIAAIFALMTGSSGQGPYSLSSTSLVASQNFGHLQGNDVLTYNSQGFYSTDLQTGQRKTLYSGKLPTVKSLRWAGTTGAVVVFGDNITGTAVEDYIEERGRQLDNVTRNFTWFINFDRKSLTLMHEAPVGDEATMFDQVNQVFYYVRTVRMRDDTQLRMYAYSVNDRVSRVQFETSTISSVRAITNCSTPVRVCVVARLNDDGSNSTLYSLGDTGTLTGVLGNNGEILDTGSRDYYITAASKKADFEQRTTLRDLRRGKEYPLNIDLDQNSYARFVSDTEFYVFNGRTGSYWAGEVKEDDVSLRRHSLSQNDKLFNKNLKSGLTAINGVGNARMSLVTGNDGRQYVFGPSKIDSSKLVAK